MIRRQRPRREIIPRRGANWGGIGRPGTVKSLGETEVHLMDDLMDEMNKTTAALVATIPKRARTTRAILRYTFRLKLITPWCLMEGAGILGSLGGAI